ncbi:MAG: nucleoside triphosphate pyrophosphohydrolase family protein [Chloroflexota bacterium]|nr:nucleoside triphosphate pyrophosphohydrolase family protein [Chloroflexota bacterium]
MFADDYQDEAMRTASRGTPRQDVIMAALGLNGEAGEVADLIKKWVGHGHPLDPDKLKEELGDVLWYCALTCQAMGWKLGEVMQQNLTKLARRYPDGFSTEASLARMDKAS